jgi:hypothetical protein
MMAGEVVSEEVAMRQPSVFIRERQPRRLPS